MSARRSIFHGGCLAAALATGLAGCGHTPEATEATAKADTTKPVPVTVAPLEHRTIERTVEAIGSLRGWEQVTVGAKKSGQVIRIYHDMGDRIEPGEPLVELETVDAKLAVDEAESHYLGALVKLGVTRQQAEDTVKTYGISEDLLSNRMIDQAIERAPSVQERRIARDKAQQNMARQRALTQRGAGTVQELDDAENDYKSASAAYENAIFAARVTIADAYAARVALRKAEQALKDMTIRAPEPLPPPSDFAGTEKIHYAMVTRQVTEGQILREGEAVAELVVEHPLRLWTRVPEVHVEDVHVGQPVRVTTRAHPDLTFEGRVVRISPSVDPTSRTFQVETLIPNKRGLLRPGGLARASIVTDAQAKAAVVPIEAIVKFAGVTKIFLVDGGQARAIDGISTGVEGKGWVEVIGGQLPTAGDVVTSGQTQLADGSPVIVRGGN